MDDLVRRVTERYDPLGLPSWPSPRPDGEEAREEEYSRVSDPDRYGIVHSRGLAWADVLGELPGITVERLWDADLVGPGLVGRFDRGVRLTCDRPGTLPVLLLEGDGGRFGERGLVPVLQVSLLRPELEVALLPDCGCDACDLGSEELLTALDDTLTELLRGPYVMLRGLGSFAYWHPGGGGASGDERTFDDLMARCRRLASGDASAVPAGGEAWVNAPWFDDAG
ncbi:hypothetical protein GCM10009718_14880 [Isoptericola halotolerans]|uniref:SUKH-4 immunity protein of toxin-antitoxin system n=1 Tax=Isoptericola halotolerans TaxID=300560 RepID=A0ABX1ZYA5_9MICO|nr:DUF6226 family protein [Isoptericola halotolerans]NOV95590.1 hypothetical protein [Isoptericola halotolerans]